MKTKTAFFLVLTLLSGLAACGGGEGGGDGVSGGGSSAAPVSSSSDARFVVRDIADGVIRRNLLPSLNNGSHWETLVPGLSGTASVSGTETYSVGQSCGTNCVRTSANVNITVIFNGYAVMSANNTRTTLTGTVTYTDYTWYQQSGLTYSSGGSVSVGGNGVSYNIAETSGNFAYSDTLTFDASGSGPAYVNGWCRPSNGTTYSF